MDEKKYRKKLKEFDEELKKLGACASKEWKASGFGDIKKSEVVIVQGDRVLLEAGADVCVIVILYDGAHENVEDKKAAFVHFRSNRDIGPLENTITMMREMGAGSIKSVIGGGSEYRDTPTQYMEWEKYDKGIESLDIVRKVLKKLDVKSFEHDKLMKVHMDRIALWVATGRVKYAIQIRKKKKNQTKYEINEFVIKSHKK